MKCCYEFRFKKKQRLMPSSSDGSLLPTAGSGADEDGERQRKADVATDA